MRPVDCQSHAHYGPSGKYVLVTRDPEFTALERQFKDVSKIVERFQADAEAYRDGVAGEFYFLIHGLY